MAKVVFMEVSGQIQDNLVEGSLALMQIMVEEGLSMVLAEVVILFCSSQSPYMGSSLFCFVFFHNQLIIKM